VHFCTLVPVFIHINTIRSLREGADRRPGCPEDSGGRPELREAPETPKDYEELPSSHPSMT